MKRQELSNLKLSFKYRNHWDSTVNTQNDRKLLVAA